MGRQVRRIAVVGAAGRTGRLVVEQAAARGHAVAAVARSADRLSGGSGVRTVVGDVTDPEVARAAVAGQDAVVCVVAAPGLGRSAAVSDAVTSVVEAMRERPTPGRLVVTSSRNLVATRPRWAVVPTRFLMRHVYTDLTVAEAAVAGSGLDWTLVRATRLVDEEARGSVWTDSEADATGGHWSLPRADLAALLLDVATGAEHTPGVIGVNGVVPGRRRPPR